MKIKALEPKRKRRMNFNSCFERESTEGKKKGVGEKRFALFGTEYPYRQTFLSYCQSFLQGSSFPRKRESGDLKKKVKKITLNKQKQTKKKEDIR